MLKKDEKVVQIVDGYTDEVRERMTTLADMDHGRDRRLYCVNNISKE